jgi:hypothetical protein
MARKRGAKDKSKRKIPVQSRIRPAIHSAQTTPPVRMQAAPEPQRASGPERPAIPPDDFKAAIAAELGKADTHVDPGQTSPAVQGGSAPVAFDPGSLTLDGLASAWQLPFYVLALGLAWLRITPDPEPIIAVGRRRAKDLAKPSYAVYEYLLREYLGVHPEHQLYGAAGATALNGIGIVPEIVEAVRQARRKAASPQPMAGTP